MTNQDILILKKQLLPTGRAFKVPTGGDFENLLLGSGVQESETFNDVLSLLDSLIPDNLNFGVDDCSAWEKTLSVSPSLDLKDRQNAIYSKMQFPFNAKGRQHKNYLEYRLNQFINPTNDPAKGCKIYEWLDIQEFISSLNHSLTTYHGVSPITGIETIHELMVFPSFTQVVSNYIEPEKEPTIILDSLNMKNFFWISGLEFNTPLVVSSDLTSDLRPDMISEFRHIILQTKPIQTIGLIQTT